MALSIALGNSDFRSLREGGRTYVDKTVLVKECLDDPSQVLLLPRPRRFGKTMGLSTIGYFLGRSDEDLSPLFQGLSIFAAGGAYREHFQRYPLIVLSFKDVKSSTWENCRGAMAGVIAAAYGQHQSLLTDGTLAPHESAAFQAILEERAADPVLWESLGKLSSYLLRRHKEQVVLLLDEYDTPIHSAYLNGYYDRAIEFFRALLTAALKDNRSLFKGIVTGVLRVAKESLFSGLNNVAVYSLLSRRFATAFGFTQGEVDDLARRAGLESARPQIRAWYNGYLFGGEVVYNPWSVLSYLHNPEDGWQPYWASTSSNDLLREILLAYGLGQQGEIEDLLQGQPIRKPISEAVALSDLGEPDAVWSFLLMSGYLKATGVEQEDLRRIATLEIPNLEVKAVYASIFQGWLQRGLGGGSQVQQLLRALVQGEPEEAERLLCTLLDSLSAHDTAPRRRKDPWRPGHPGPAPLTPEQIYHAFVLGVLVSVQPQYRVLSNRESGYGRYDVMLAPPAPGQPGVVLELKVRDHRRRETAEQAMKRALKQLRDKDYARELIATGARPIHQYGVVFDRKRAWVRAMGE